MRYSKLLPLDVHNSWKGFLDDTILNELLLIEEKIRDNHTPPAENVLRFMVNDLDALKVIILGQDPYPEKGRATGRAFEVGDMTLWNASFKQVSLKNIVRLLHKTYNNIENYDDIKSFNQIKEEIEKGQFNILPPHELFKSWERQGVLLLNSYLTCEVGKPGSHREIWPEFAGRLIEYISGRKPGLKWFLWGKNANSYSEHIIKGKIYSSRHPMMCSGAYEDDFLKAICFKETADTVNWLG